jgi:RHS repeat-associated protein
LSAGNYASSLNSEKNQFGTYDAAGNPPGQFDALNRMTRNGMVTYGYDSANGMAVRSEPVLGGELNQVYLRVGGTLLATYRYRWEDGQWKEGMAPPMPRLGGREIRRQDRIGSAVAGLQPYGEDPTGAAHTGSTFATYWRETPVLDYANQRWYTVGWGRFTTPDPYMASGGVGSPSSWNRYTYVEGDPVNFNDPTGLFLLAPHDFGFGGDPIEAIFGLQRNRDYPMSPREKKEQKMRVQIETAVAGFVKRLQLEDCERLFGVTDFGDDDARHPSAILAKYQTEKGIRSISKSALPPGTPRETAGFVAGGAGGFIYFVDNRAFFTNTANGRPLTGPMSGLSGASTHELMVIHELMHFMGVVGPDNAGQQIQLPNGRVVTGSAGVSQAIRDDCF